MRTIIRCPSCFTFVYSDARHCHGCGRAIGKRRFLTRGSWVFITLVVAVYAIARGIDLHQSERDRRRHEMETALEMERSTRFLRQWLTAPADEIASAHSGSGSFGPELVKLRSRFPTVLPATDIASTLLKERTSWEPHSQTGLGPVVHGRGERETALRASWPIPQGTSYFDLRRGTRRRDWGSTRYDFVVEVVRDGSRYSIVGSICLDDPDDTVHCLTILRIEGVEGVVKPVE
jgi:hypothetical protein